MAAPKVAVLAFPARTAKSKRGGGAGDVGLDAQVVHWSRADALTEYDAYVLPGGFAVPEDRIRAGAVPAHDPMMDYVIEGAQKGKLVFRNLQRRADFAGRTRSRNGTV